MPTTAKAQSTTPAISGGRLLAQQLALHGADTVFAVPGESYLDLLDGLYDVREDVRLITCRFEAGAVNMAEAYGKLTGKPGVAIVTRGPGACHGAIGVHTAQQDSTPLILLVGQIPSDEMDRDSFQEIDYRKMFGSIAKWTTQIDQAERIPEIMHRAFHVAVSGRPRPGGDCVAGGHATRQGGGRSRPPLRRTRAALRSRPGRGHARHAGQGAPPAGAAGRQRLLDRSGPRRHAGLRRGQPPARGGRLPPPGYVRRHFGLLRR